MKSENNTSDESRYGRRAVLKSVETAAAGTVLGTLATGTASARDDCALDWDDDYYSELSYEARDQTTDYSESQYRKDFYTIVYRAIELRSSATILDSWYDSYHDQYKSHVLISGHIQTQEDDGGWDHYPNIYDMTTTVENKRPTTSDMLTSESSDWIGGTPADNGTDVNFGDAAFTVLKAAISKTNPTLGMAVTAADATYQLMSGDENTNEFDEKEEYVWTYGTFGKPCEAANFVKIELQAHPGETTMEADLINEATNDSPDMTVSKGWNCYIYEDWYHDISGASGAAMDLDRNDRPEPGTDEYEEYLEESDRFVKVPYDQLRDKSKTEPGYPIYRSKDPKISITPI